MGEKKTYLINIDGMRADYFGTVGHQGCLTPTLVSLAEQGIRFSNCKTIMPANTGTNHTAIMTSAHAGSHGILGVGGCYKGLNKEYFRFSKKYGTILTGMYEHKHLQIPTFFNIIKTNNPNLITAFIPGKTWLGNIIADEDCDVTIFTGNTKDNCGKHKANPEYVTDSEGYVLGGLAHPEDNEILPRFYFPKKGEIEMEPPGTLNAALVKIDADSLPSDKWIIDQAINCVDNDDPDFMYMILMNLDMAGHAYGAFLSDKNPDEVDVKNLCTLRNPNAARDQLYLTDLEVKRFIDHLRKKELYHDARIIIISDHGMNTTKSMFSGISRKRRLYWLLEKLHIVKWSEIYKSFLFAELKEELDIDIRRIFAEHEIHMRASQGRWFHRYNKQGDYDWCYSDGGIVGCIYNVDLSTQRKIKTILRDYTIKENGKTMHPIWNVLTEEDMNDAENEYTHRPFRLGRGDFNNEYDAMWPSVIVFPRPHYMIPMYNDQLYAGLMPLMVHVNLPGFIDFRTAPGLHGTYLEQDVPLIFVSPNEPEVPSGVVYNEQVSVLDIIPTINFLNGWPDQSSFEGRPIIPISKKREKKGRVKPEISVSTSK